jgi:threonylcarbamoyladenosine tRNA methylthiotransferase MtaB
MSGVVPISERKRRNKMLRILSAKKLRAFYETQKGKNLTVIFEHENKNGYMYGFTQNYVKVKYPYNSELSNQPVNITIADFDEEGNMNCVLNKKVNV